MKHMRLRVVFKEGFALPTILIASVIMLTVLTSAVTAVSSISTSIEAHYHNQLAREAAESGMARANDCLKQSPTGTPQWTDMKPLRPNTDCSGNILTDKSQYITESGNVRTSFRVGRPSSGSNDATRISSTGDIGLVRSTDANTIWRAYTQTITQDARYQSQPKIAGGSGWLDAGHTAAVITTDGQLYGFGSNNATQVNDLSSPANVMFPSKYTLPAGVSTVVSAKLSGQGAYLVCILANTGQVYCRGDGMANQTLSGWQQFILPAGLTATNFYLDGYGANAMCVLASNGQAYCAGENRYGSLGSGDTTLANYPITAPRQFIIPAGRTLQKIITSSHVTCGILNSTVAGVPGDDMYCAGKNSVGQITGPSTSGTGNGFYATPIRYNIPGARKIKDVSISYHSMIDNPTVHVLGSDGSIWSSGSYANGDLGHSTTTGSTGTTQTPIAFTTSQANYAAGSIFWHANASKCIDNNANLSTNGNKIHLWSCAATNNGPQTWYYGTEQQLTNFGTGKCLDVPGNSSTDGTAVQLYDCNGSAAQRFDLVGGISGNTVRHISSGKCLDARSGGTADGTIIQIYTCNGTAAQSFTRWAGIMGWQGMITGTDHFCGLRPDLWSGMWCSGKNDHGQLLNWATTTNSFLGQCVSTPTGGYNYLNVNLPGDSVDISKLSDEWRQQFKSTMVIGASGKVYGAGRDQYGKFGNGALDPANDFQNCVTREFQLPAGVTAMDLSTRDEFTTYVLGSDGRVYAAGRNANGQVGDGTTTDRLVPVEVKIPRQKTNY